MVSQEIKEKVLILCQNQNWDWEWHIRSVVKRARYLAKKLNADEQVVETASWLHDIAKLEGYSRHHIKGSEIAGEILKETNFPEEKIKLVKNCILTHSSDSEHKPKTKEEMILSNADGLFFYDNFLSLFKQSMKTQDSEEFIKYLLNKNEEAWSKLMPEAKELAREKYNAIKTLFNK